MQNLYFNFFFFLSFFIFIISPSFSESERQSLDLNEKETTGDNLQGLQRLVEVLQVEIALT